MRKSIITAFLLLLLSGVFLVAACGQVNDRRDAIEIEETVLFGDRQAARGIAVTSRIQSNNRLFWDTTYTLGEELEVQTNFRFSQEEEYYRGNREPQIEFENEKKSTSDLTKDLRRICGATDPKCAKRLGLRPDEILLEDQYTQREAIPLQAAGDVAGRTPKGETRTETLFFKDYYEYYPVDVDVRAMDFYLKREQETREKLWKYFHIPIPENYQFQITITKDSEGHVVAAEFQDVSDGMNIYERGIPVESGNYIALSSWVDDTGRRVPLPEDGAGIHFIPLKGSQHEGESSGALWIVPEQMKLVYPLENPESEVLALRKDQEGRLLLFTEEQDGIVLSVLDQKTMKRLQRVRLSPGRVEGGIREIRQHDDFLVLFLADQSFLLILEDGEGGYGLELTGTTGESGPPDQWLDPYYAEVDYDGKQMAMAFCISSYEDSCTTYLLVYDNNGGLIYSGQYRNSVDRGSDNRIMPTYENPMTVTCPQ